MPSSDPDNRTETPPISGDPPNPIDPPPGCRFHTRCPLASDVCRAKRPPLAEVEPGRFVACHHWEAARAGVPAAADAPAHSPAAERRFALYRERSLAATADGAERAS